MTAGPQTAMLLAAGLGTRMRPITEHTPKPLVRVGGKALIDWTLDSLAESGVTRAIVNVHHHAEQMRRHLQMRRRPHVTISDESDRLLDTGGGIVKALPLLGGEPFFVCNCDSILSDGTESPFARLGVAFDPAQLDIVMLLQACDRAHGFDGPGDFFVADNGTLTRRGSAPSAPFVYAGVWIAHPRAFAGETAVPFSANRIWDRALAAGRMIGVVHDGAWYHVGTPDAVAATATLLSGTAA